MPTRRLSRIFDTDIIWSGAARIRTALGLAIGTDVQAWDADLDAIAALASNGLIARTGAGTVAARTITAGSGISIVDGDGVAGNPTITATAAVPNVIYFHGATHTAAGTGTFDLSTVFTSTTTVEDAVGSWIRLTGTGEESCSTPGALHFWAQQDITFFARIRTGSSIADLRFYTGLASGSTARFANNDTQAALNAIAFRYSTGAADTTWIAHVNTGAGLTATDTGVAVAVDTEYLLKIVLSGDGTTATFTVNGAGSTAVTTNIPTSVDLGAGCAMFPIAGTKTVDVKVFGVDAGFSFY